jgi:hypothetical protein
MSNAISQYNSHGADGYDRVWIDHDTCAFYEKDDNSNVKINVKSRTGYASYNELVDAINDEGKSGYQFLNSMILTGSNGNLLTLKQYSNTADQTYHSEFQDFVAFGSNGATKLLNQLNEEADKRYLFTNNVMSVSSGKILDVKTLYSQHIANTQKVVYEYLEHSGIVDLITKLNTVGAQGGLLSHYGNLVIYEDSLAGGSKDTKTAIGYNLDCSSGPCKVIY